MITQRSRRRGIRRSLAALSLVALALFGDAASGSTLRADGPTGSAGPIGPVASPLVAIIPLEPAAGPSAEITPVPNGTRTAEPGPTPLGSPPAGPGALPDPGGSTPIATIPGGPQLPGDDRVISPATRLALQARLDQLRRKYAIPGLSAAIILRDGSTWVGTSGKADVATGRKVSRDTGFAVASVSKTFTAALVMALVEEGQIALDGSVATYLPELGLDAGITVRQLLNHTSGLSDFFFHPRIDKLLIKQPARRWRPERSLKFVGTPYFQPGRGWHYSNTNYLLLGLLVEQVTGRSLSAELRTRFLEPLGLSHTSYQPSDSPTGPLAHGYRFDVGARNDRPIDLSDGSTIVPFTSVVTAAAGAGGIAANSIDIARWARALYGGRVLSPASLQAMVEAAILTQPYQPSVPYGLGVQVLDFAGQQSLGHSGRLLGFRAVMRYLPASGLSVAVLTNQSRTDPAIVAWALVAIALEAGQACSCSGSR